MGRMGGPGKKRGRLMSLINSGPGFILSLSTTHPIDFQVVPRGYRGQGDGDLGQIDAAEFSDGSDAGPIKPWAVLHRLCPENISHAVGNNKERIFIKASSHLPRCLSMTLCITKAAVSWA